MQRFADATRSISPLAQVVKTSSRIYATNKWKDVAINTPHRDTKDLECYHCGGNGHYVAVSPTMNSSYLDNKDDDGVLWI